MNVEADNVEKKAVHSWSRISSAGQKALEEALRVFNPMSKDLSDTETQLIAFLQGLKEEGYQPTILRSKDVYGYSSCTANAPGQTKGCHRDIPEPEPAKAPARKIVTVKKVSDPLAGMTVSSSKDSTKPTSKGSNSTNLLLNSLKQTRSGTSKASAVGFPANMYPGVYPAMRLSVVLEALVPLKATASCLESKCQQGHRGIASSDLKLLKASSASIQSSAVKATKILPSQLDPKGLNPKGHRRLITKVPDSATLAVSLIKGPKGGMPQECHAYKASGILNGRIPGSNFQSCSPGASRMKEPSEARTEQESGGLRQETVGPKRKRVGEGKELCRKMPNCIPSPDKQGLDSKTLNLLKFQAIKVNSSSDDELRRRAQKILRVNLSPVIRIQPLPCSPSGP